MVMLGLEELQITSYYLKVPLEVPRNTQNYLELPKDTSKKVAVPQK